MSHPAVWPKSRQPLSHLLSFKTTQHFISKRCVCVQFTGDASSKGRKIHFSCPFYTPALKARVLYFVHVVRVTHIQHGTCNPSKTQTHTRVRGSEEQMKNVKEQVCWM